MVRSRHRLAVLALLPAFAAGCVRATTTVRQDDGSVRTTTHLVVASDLLDLTFRADEDCAVASTFWGVTYAWPKGEGSLSEDFREMRFRGRSVTCSVVGRRLTIDGRQLELAEGDHVRITGDGRVFVNDFER
jgi:hypothetical protein